VDALAGRRSSNRERREFGVSEAIDYDELICVGWFTMMRGWITVLARDKPVAVFVWMGKNVVEG
jgi:hypothetical protein